MTSHCEIFVPAEKENSLDLFHVIEQNFSKTLELLHQWAVKNQINLEEIVKDSAEDILRREKNITNARTNETSKLAIEYRIESMNFRSKNKSVREQFKQTLVSRAELNLPTDLSALSEIENAFQIISWYEQQVPVKISRAYIGMYENDHSGTDPIQNDYNGSAKVVLIGIEKSLPAWEIIMKHFPQLEDECFKFLVLLDRIRKRILVDFPNANEFIRPGFDKLTLA